MPGVAPAASEASPVSEAVVYRAARGGDLPQFHDPPLHLRFALGVDHSAVRRLLPDVCRVYGAGRDAADAARAVVWVDRFLYLGSGKYRDVPGRLALSASGQRLESRSVGEIQLMVLAGHRIVHDRGPVEACEGRPLPPIPEHRTAASDAIKT